MYFQKVSACLSRSRPSSVVQSRVLRFARVAVKPVSADAFGKVLVGAFRPPLLSDIIIAQNRRLSICLRKLVDVKMGLATHFDAQNGL